MEKRFWQGVKILQCWLFLYLPVEFDLAFKNIVAVQCAAGELRQNNRCFSYLGDQKNLIRQEKKKNWQVEIITNKDEKNGENWQRNCQESSRWPTEVWLCAFLLLIDHPGQLARSRQAVQQLEIKALSPCIYWPKYRFPVAPLEDFS